MTMQRIWLVLGGLVLFIALVDLLPKKPTICAAGMHGEAIGGAILISGC